MSSPSGRCCCVCHNSHDSIGALDNFLKVSLPCSNRSACLPIDLSDLLGFRIVTRLFIDRQPLSLLYRDCTQIFSGHTYGERWSAGEDEQAEEDQE